MIYRGFNFDYERAALTINVINLFINDNLSYREISKKLNLSLDKVEAIINNENEVIILYGEKAREVLEKIHIRKAQIAKELQVKQEQGNMLDLSIMAKDPKNHNNLIVQLALTFRANSETVQELFGVNVNSLIWGNTYDAFLYLEGFENLNQEIVKQRICEFYANYKKAREEKKREEQIDLIHQITDFDARELRKRRIGSPLSDENIRTIINYQLKYALTTTAISKIFSLDRDKYAKRVQALVTQEGYEELRIRFEHLSSYNEINRQAYIKNAL